MYIFTRIGARTQASFGASPKTFSPQAAGAGINAVEVQALTQNVRISFDTTNNASASEGMQIKAGDPVKLIILGGQSFTYQQETSGAAFYLQPGRLDWTEP